MFRFVSRLLVAALLFAGPASLSAFAQAKDKDVKKDDKGEPASFETVDGVTLKGTFYPSAKRQAAPATVLMIHNIGESSQKKDWKELAEELQKKDFAVLIFDLRGHGQSTDIDPAKFWDPLQNSRFNITLVKGYTTTNQKTTIKTSDFQKNYYGAFINDIAAAKAYLDRKNDNRECNTSNFIVIGAQEGAALGAVWLQSEHHRHRVTEELVGVNRIDTPEKYPEGKDVIGAVWLSMSSGVGGRTLRMPQILHQAAKVKATPMYFLYGDKDTTAKDNARTWERGIKSAKEKEKYQFTAAMGVKDTSLKGVGLLTIKETKQEIVKFVQDAASEKNNEWILRDYKKAKFVWVRPGVSLILRPYTVLDYNAQLLFLAKPTNEMQLLFDTYERFLRS